MAEYPLQFATQQIRRAFARAIGRSIPKILTELITNGDDATVAWPRPKSAGMWTSPLLSRFNSKEARGEVLFDRLSATRHSA